MIRLLHILKTAPRIISLLLLSCVIVLILGVFHYMKVLKSAKKEQADQIAIDFQSFLKDKIDELSNNSRKDVFNLEFTKNLDEFTDYYICVFKKQVNTLELGIKSKDYFPKDTILKFIGIQMDLGKSDLPKINTIALDSFHYFTCIRTFTKDTFDKSGILLIYMKPVEKLINEFDRHGFNSFACGIKRFSTLILSQKSSFISNDAVRNYLLKANSPFCHKFKYVHRYKVIKGSVEELPDHIQSFVLSDVTVPILLPLLFIIFLFLVISSLAMLYLFYRNRLQKQIAEINNALIAVSQKEFDRKLSEEYEGEIGLLAKSINSMSLQLKEIYDDLEIKVVKRTSEISMRNAELRTKQREILKQNHELKSAYDALKDSREKYEKLVEQLEEEYIFYSQSVKGELLYVSTSVKKILDFDVKEYRKLSEKLYTDNPINLIAKERSLNLRNGIAQPKYLKEIYDAKHQPRILEVTEVPVFNDEGQLVSVEGVAHDITEREKAEELIKEQEEKYRMLFTYASDFIFLYELDKVNAKAGCIIEANNYMIEQLGFSHDELRLKAPSDLFAAEFIEEGGGRDNAEYLANDIKYERIWESKDGNTLNVEISSHAYKIRDQHVAIAVARDISERKRAVEEIRFVNEELTNQKENLEALVDNLTQTQEQLVQSEKMAALGQLIAGIAHEINTPLGAIKASIGNLGDSLENALKELPALLQQQSKENLELFSELFNLAHKKAPELSSREKRQLKRELTGKLKQNGIDQPDLMAEILAFLDVYEIDQNLITQLKLPESINIIRSVRNFISLLKNTTTINIAVEKATKVVFALKKYAHRDSGGEKVPTDIIDGIETVLTLYHNQLKQGIEVIREYESLPLIQCYQDEISQVWTNLVQNAIQAMNLEGTLTITAKYLNNSISIRFKDTGTGIEPDIQEKIFEPFFTTKKQGEGSGLGLDIVKKIIEKHDGTIRVESVLGKGATFIIDIPVN